MISPLPPLLLFNGKMLNQVKAFCDENMNLCSKFQSPDDTPNTTLYSAEKEKMHFMLGILPFTSLAIGSLLTVIDFGIRKQICIQQDSEHLQLMPQSEGPRNCYRFFANFKKHVIPTKTNAMYIISNLTTILLVSVFSSYGTSLAYSSLICNNMVSSSPCDYTFPNITQADAEKLSKLSNDVFDSQMAHNIPTGIAVSIGLLFCAVSLTAYLKYQEQEKPFEGNAESAFAI